MNRTSGNERQNGGFNLSGGGLVGDKDAGLEQAREAGAARGHDVPDAADSSTAGGPGTSTGPGISRVGSGATGLNNYSPGSDLSAGTERPEVDAHRHDGSGRASRDG